MYIRINNQILQVVPTFSSDYLYIRFRSDDFTYGDVATLFNGETIEFLNDAQSDITRKYWIKRIVSIAIVNADPRTFEISLDVSSVGDGSVVEMQTDILEAGDALIELAEMISNHEERLEAVEAYNARIIKNAEDIANVRIANETVESINTIIHQLMERIAVLESVIDGGGNA